MIVTNVSKKRSHTKKKKNQGTKNKRIEIGLYDDEKEYPFIVSAYVNLNISINIKMSFC